MDRTASDADIENRQVQGTSLYEVSEVGRKQKERSCMGEQIILEGAVLDGKLADLTQNFTGMKDKLNFLKEEEDKLSAIWQGTAKETWELVFLEEIEKLEVDLKKSIQGLAVLKEQALKLKKEEQEILALIAALPG